MIKHILTVISLVSTTLNPIPMDKASVPLEQNTSVEKVAAVPETSKTLLLWVTAYSSTPEETDDTPFITARGTAVRDGIIATNLLPFGSRVKIPKLFGDKIFTVEDRMHRRKENFIDVWMPTKEDAEKLGINFTEVTVLN
ncbi:MAG: hypothetical protein AAB935_00080 [Patescibacteria group bacterium]